MGSIADWKQCDALTTRGLGLLRVRVQLRGSSTKLDPWPAFPLIIVSDLLAYQIPSIFSFWILNFVLCCLSQSGVAVSRWLVPCSKEVLSLNPPCVDYSHSSETGMLRLIYHSKLPSVVCVCVRGYSSLLLCDGRVLCPGRTLPPQQSCMDY